MSLSTEAAVAENIRRIINNGFHSHHPFRTEFEDYVSIYADIRRLSSRNFLHCLEAIKDVVELNRGCTDCYGKGLAYVKLLMQGIYEDEYNNASAKYVEFSSARDRDRDFEDEILQELNRQSIKI